MMNYAPSLKVKAAAELERRRRLAERKRPAFGEWLPQVTPSYSWHWLHLAYIRTYLDKITDGTLKRLMLFVPPRHGKSEMVTVRYPVYRLEQNPGLKVIVGAYNQTLADKFSRKSRKIARERIALSNERTAVEDWETSAGGGVRAVGVGGGITGQGGDLIIIDDPVKSREEAESPAYRERCWEWYTDDLYTRAEPGAAIILIMTRWHEDDLAGRILASEDGPNWTVINLPAEAEENDPLGREPGQALCPERYDEQALAERKMVLGDSYWALFQQRPVSPSGAIFKREWWDGKARYNPADKGLFYKCVARWLFLDTAMKANSANDFTAWSVVELLPDYSLVWRLVGQEKLLFPDLIDKIETLAHYHNRDEKLRGIVIEDKNSGTSAIQTMRAASPDWLASLIMAFQPAADKVYRGKQASTWGQRGMILLPEPSEDVPWLYDFEQQLFNFPASAHDDMVDTLTMGIIYLEHLLKAGWQVRMGQVA